MNFVYNYVAEPCVCVGSFNDISITTIFLCKSIFPRICFLSYVPSFFSWSPLYMSYRKESLPTIEIVFHIVNNKSSEYLREASRSYYQNLSLFRFPFQRKIYYDALYQENILLSLPSDSLSAYPSMYWRLTFIL